MFERAFSGGAKGFHGRHCESVGKDLESGSLVGKASYEASLAGEVDLSSLTKQLARTRAGRCSFRLVGADYIHVCGYFRAALRSVVIAIRL